MIGEIDGEDCLKDPSCVSVKWAVETEVKHLDHEESKVKVVKHDECESELKLDTDKSNECSVVTEKECDESKVLEEYCISADKAVKEIGSLVEAAVTSLGDDELVPNEYVGKSGESTLLK